MSTPSNLRAIDTVIVEEHVHFTLDELCRACRVEHERVVVLVHEGVLEPAGHEPREWRFDGASLGRARLALRLIRDLELDANGVALVLDLLEENARLRAQLRQAGGR